MTNPPSNTLARWVLVVALSVLGARILEPAAARAQWAAAGGASIADVLAALVGQDVSFNKATATATSGAAFTCNSALTQCIKMPGTDMSIGSDGTHVLIGAASSTTVKLRVGEAFVADGDGDVLLNGVLDFYNAGTMRRSIGGAVRVDDTQGFNIQEQTLTTCALATEGDIMRDVAAGGTTGERTRLCICVSDGEPTPAYKWHNLGNFGDTSGTTTTCPA